MLSLVERHKIQTRSPQSTKETTPGVGAVVEERCHRCASADAFDSNDEMQPAIPGNPATATSSCRSAFSRKRVSLRPRLWDHLHSAVDERCGELLGYSPCLMSGNNGARIGKFPNARPMKTRLADRRSTFARRQKAANRCEVRPRHHRLPCDLPFTLNAL